MWILGWGGRAKLIEEGNVSFGAGVEPVAYTETGLWFSDGRFIEMDAVIWCTGSLTRMSLTRRPRYSARPNHVRTSDGKHTQTPLEIASPPDATWGDGSEGEIRGMWKRHSNVVNIWIMGVYTQQHRWHSQINADLEGVFPEAYDGLRHRH
jgi:hypothetical protein